MNRAIWMAVAFALALFLWMLSGIVLRVASGDESIEEGPSQRQLPQVRVRLQEAESVLREVLVHGRTAPDRQVMVRAETNGRVMEVAAERGSRVAEGDLLVRLDLRDREERRAALETLLAQRILDRQAAERLLARGLQSENALAAARAAEADTRAMLEAAELDLEHMVIRAPFGGILADRPVEVGDFVQMGDPVAHILDLDPILLTGGVTEREIERLQVGAEARGQLATGEVVTGTIRYLAPQSDAGNRQFTVEVAAPNPDLIIPAGVTAEIFLAGEEVPAHFLSTAVIVLDDQGVFGVKAVDENDRVRFLPATLVKTTAEGIYLGNLPEQMRLITVGQGFVNPGDAVRVQMDQSTLVDPEALEEEHRSQQTGLLPGHAAEETSDHQPNP